MAVKAAKLYSSNDGEPRVYSVERLAEAGIISPRHLPSVTTVLRVLNKPAFVPAALKAMGDHLVGQAERIYYATADMDPQEFALFFGTEVGEAKKAWGERSKVAMDIGTRIHKLCEAHGRGAFASLKDEPSEVVNGFEAYLAWVNETGFVATEVEKVVADPIAGYAGCCDAVGIMRDGTPVLVDWKSGKGGAIYPEYILQWHAYAAPLSIDSGYIVSFDKETGECYQHPMKFHTLTYEAFLYATLIYEWLHADEDKR